MNYNLVMTIIHLVMFAIFIFSTTAFIFYKRKRLEEIKQKQMEKDAQQYFVTICHRLITPFGDETTSSDYYTFRIVSNHFFVMRMTRNQTSRTKAKMVMSAEFKGMHIFDHDTSKNYFFNEFDSHLVKFIGDSPVHDFYVKCLWEQMQAIEKLENTDSAN